VPILSKPSRQGEEIFLSSTALKPAGGIQPYIQWVPGVTASADVQFGVDKVQLHSTDMMNTQ
jgi:hypothetical protein